MKKFAKQRKYFLRGDNQLGSTQQKQSFFRDTQGKSRAALHQTVTCEEQNEADLSVLFQPLSTANMSTTMKRASSGLKSTKKLGNAGNRSQFLTSQKVNVSAIDSTISPNQLQTYQTQTAMPSQFGGTPDPQQSNKTSSRMKQTVPKKT